MIVSSDYRDNFFNGLRERIKVNRFFRAKYVCTVYYLFSLDTLQNRQSRSQQRRDYGLYFLLQFGIHELDEPRIIGHKIEGGDNGSSFHLSRVKYPPLCCSH